MLITLKCKCLFWPPHISKQTLTHLTTTKSRATFNEMFLNITCYFLHKKIAKHLRNVYSANCEFKLLGM
jgi:hypothetical protein